MPKRSTLKVMMKLITLIKPLILIMVFAVTLGLLGALAASLITILGAKALLEITASNNSDISIIFISMIVLAVSRAILRYGEQYFNHYIAFKTLALIRDLVYKQLRRLAPAKLEGKDKGDLISLITSDIELLEVFYAHTISPILIATIFSILMVVFIGSYSIILGVIALGAYLLVGYVLPMMINKYGSDYGIKFRNKVGELSSFILDALRGIKEVIQYKYSERINMEIVSKTDDLLKEEAKLKKLQGNTMSISNTIIMFSNLVMFTCAAYLYLNNKLSFEGMIISIVTLMSSFGPVIALANLGSTLQNTIAAGNRVLDLLDEEPQIVEVINDNLIRFEDVTVNNVNFRYEDELIIENMTLDLSKNKIVGLIGKSGSGKSTLLKLMMRFWEVESGEIKISGKNINTIDTRNLRSIQSYMTQDTHLFNDTIENNIKLVKLDASFEEIIDACKKAAIHDFIISLPQGYKTNVGELGDLISGGEKQRLGLARIFLHNADLILLDEPTSNLDSLNESIILQSLLKYKKDKAIILVSHRESTLRITEKIIKVENGRLS